MMDNPQTCSNLAGIYHFSHRKHRMMRKNQAKRIIFTGLVVLVLGMLPFVGKAQVPDPAVDPDTPIDGGVTLLVAAGIGYGFKKYKDGQREKQSDIA
jgi:hypothetical protein